MNSDSSSRKSVQPKLRERIREATTNEILAAADGLFRERGVDRTSMADIAAQAGLAVGTLYNHFRDREALLRTLLDNHLTRLLNELDAAIVACAGQPFAVQLRSVLTSYFISFEKHRPLIESMLQSSDSCLPVPMKPKILREIYARFEILAKRGLAESALDKRLAGLLPTLLLGVARTIVVSPLLTGAPKMHESDIELLATFFMNGAGAEK